MAYRDFDAAEARGMWSPPNGADPQMLPDQWKDDPNSDALRYDLPDKTDAELTALGWKKIDMPSYATNGAAYFVNTYTWNRTTRAFDATAIDDSLKRYVPNYVEFWHQLLESTVYTKLKTAASSSLPANVLLTEFIALLEDGKTGMADTNKMQISISGILAGITLTADEIAELQTVFDSSGMSAVYTLS